MRYIVSFPILFCFILTSCISEELLAEKYNTTSSFYDNPVGPFKNILVLWREETVNKNRQKSFEMALKAKCVKHGTAISFVPYKTDDSAFVKRLHQICISQNIDFIIRLSHSGQFMRKTVDDPFPGIRQKNAFRVERVSFTAAGYHPGDRTRPIWKSSFSIAETSVGTADEQAMIRFYQRMLRDGILQSAFLK